jgi:hypothetical protein
VPRDYVAELKNLYGPDVFRRRPGRPKIRWTEADFVKLLVRYQTLQEILKTEGLRMPQVRVFDAMRKLWPYEYGKCKDSTLGRYRRHGRKILKSGRI